MATWAGHQTLDSHGILYGELGKQVADLMGELYLGLYHVESKVLRNTDWQDPDFIEIRMWVPDMATWDGNFLTRFVVLCHERCIRGSITPTRKNYVQFLFHPREREGSTSRRHPTLEQHLERLGRSIGAPPALIQEASAVHSLLYEVLPQLQAQRDSSNPSSLYNRLEVAAERLGNALIRHPLPKAAADPDQLVLSTAVEGT